MIFISRCLLVVMEIVFFGALLELNACVAGKSQPGNQTIGCCVQAAGPCSRTYRAHPTVRDWLPLMVIG